LPPAISCPPPVPTPPVPLAFPPLPPGALKVPPPVITRDVGFPVFPATKLLPVLGPATEVATVNVNVFVKSATGIAPASPAWSWKILPPAPPPPPTPPELLPTLPDPPPPTNKKFTTVGS